MKPTPPHLTSAAAEGLLAQACENETQNAKRMKMGLDPLPVRGKGRGGGRWFQHCHNEKCDSILQQDGRIDEIIQSLDKISIQMTKLYQEM